jgi:hypothetical protein
MARSIVVDSSGIGIAGIDFPQIVMDAPSCEKNPEVIILTYTFVITGLFIYYHIS